MTISETTASETTALVPVPPTEVQGRVAGAGWMRLWRLLADVPGMSDDAIAVLNGAVGDRLAAADNTLAIPLGFTIRGRGIDLDELTTTHPDARPRLVVLVHGLMANERSWAYAGKPPFEERLEADLDVTCVCVRYNSGRHISVNGRELAHALQDLVDAWPVPLEDLVIIGHSMGGLVSRSAGHYAAEAGLPWVAQLSRMFLLASPSRGAPLEQLANVAAFTLRAIPNPWTWGIAWVFRQRSAGIKDLRHGWLVDEEWQAKGPDALSFGRKHLVPLLPHVHHFVAAGCLAPDEHHPLAKVLGDALVAPFSAKDEGIDGTPSDRAPTDARVFPGVSHLSMAGDDDVYTQLLAWWHDSEPG